jgi:hypothetical protein
VTPSGALDCASARGEEVASIGTGVELAGFTSVLGRVLQAQVEETAPPALGLVFTSSRPVIGFLAIN